MFVVNSLTMSSTSRSASADIDYRCRDVIVTFSTMPKLFWKELSVSENQLAQEEFATRRVAEENAAGENAAAEWPPPLKQRPQPRRPLQSTLNQSLWRRRRACSIRHRKRHGGRRLLRRSQSPLGNNTVYKTVTDHAGASQEDRIANVIKDALLNPLRVTSRSTG